MSNVESLKVKAAERALEQIESGMQIGLGTGSTADKLTKLLGEKVADGFKVTAVPTSQKTAKLASSLNIPLATLEECPVLDLTIDGADEFDPSLRLIKGAGGALLREKIVASASKRMTVITDERKKVAQLGAFPLPIEIAPFGYQSTWATIAHTLQTLGFDATLTLRQDGENQPYLTDGGHYIIDAALKSIDDPQELAITLEAIAGVMGHGLFIGLATCVISAGKDGLEEFRAYRERS